MTDGPLAAFRRQGVSLSRFANPALGVGLCIAVLGLLGLSYRSIEQWRTSSEMLAEQRAEVMLTLLVVALNSDMRGAQTSVLLPLDLADLNQDPLYDFRDTVARAFARFPYVESFFVWREDARGARTFDVVNRADRPPAWDTLSVTASGYPAVLRRNPEGSGPLVDALRRHGAGPGRFVAFDVPLNGRPYQVVGKLLSVPATMSRPAVVGFTVNLAWVREHYFRELATEVSRIGDAAGLLSISIEDDQGGTVAMTRPSAGDGSMRQRSFEPRFFDPAIPLTITRMIPAARPWIARVSAANELTYFAPVRGAYAVLAAAAVATVVGMLLTVRAARARAALAAMQSDFMYGVTHELKTPLSLIRLMAETLGHRRYSSQEAVTDYARLLSQEAWRLTRLIDNILAFARVTDSGGKHPFDPIDPSELVDDVLERFRPQLTDGAFDVKVDMPADLPRIRGDRTMIAQALDNLVDNAIKYSAERRELSVRLSTRDSVLQVEVADRGAGIAPDEVPLVFDKFYRGRLAAAGGSGLGLAIVKRIVEDHGGTVEMTSALGGGTSVRLVLPVDKDDVEASADS